MQRIWLLLLLIMILNNKENSGKNITACDREKLLTSLDPDNQISKNKYTHSTLA